MTDRHGRNPLFLALTVFALKTFEKLLIAKVNPDSPGPDGRKIIIHAIEKGQGKFIELLLRVCFAINLTLISNLMHLQLSLVLFYSLKVSRNLFYAINKFSSNLIAFH